MIKTHILFSVLILFIVLVISVFSEKVKAIQDDAEKAISSANATLSNCYTAVREAQIKGANVTVLTTTLNEAADLLSNAELAYSARNYISAYNLAVQSQNKLEIVVLEISLVEEMGVQNSSRDFGYNVMLPLVGFMTIIIGMSAWTLSNRKEKTR